MSVFIDAENWDRTLFNNDYYFDIENTWIKYLNEKVVDKMINIILQLKRIVSLEKEKKRSWLSSSFDLEMKKWM